LEYWGWERNGNKSSLFSHSCCVRSSDASLP
jgi:hypothetical protein